MRVELRFVRGARAGQSLPLDDNQSVVIGRGVETTFRIQDPSISRRHCQITNSPQGVLLADLGSSNGTYVNGQRIGTWVQLRPNDQVILGNNEILIASPTPTTVFQPPPPQGLTQPLSPQQMQAQPVAAQAMPPMHQVAAAIPLQAQQQAAQNAQQQGSRCSNCGRPVQPTEILQGLVRQDTNGRLVCGDCLKQFDFDPNLVDGFVISKKLGQGAFGAVYKATQTATGRIVALKTIKPQLVSNEKDIKRFFREAEMGAKLVHPHITAVFDAGESKGTYFIAMEYIDGRELTKLIEQYNKLDIGYSLRIAIQIANALGTFYANGIVHRDIKPDNILVTQQAAAKLVDFGLAKSFEGAGQSGLTEQGEGMGTLAYMPPEQLDNALNADQRADIYSLGASLYHCLAGRRPFEEKTTRQFILKILNQMPPPLRSVNPTVPQPVQEIIERAMAKRPEDRFQTPKEFEDALLSIFNKLAAQYAAQQQAAKR